MQTEHEVVHFVLGNSARVSVYGYLENYKQEHEKRQDMEALTQSQYQVPRYTPPPRPVSHETTRQLLRELPI